MWGAGVAGASLLTCGAVRRSSSGETRAATGTNIIGSESGGSGLIYMRRWGASIAGEPAATGTDIAVGT